MVAAYEKLPEGYRLRRRIHLIQNQKLLKRLVALQAVLFMASLGCGLLIHPLFIGGWRMVLLRLIAAAAGYAVYIIGHEAVHGALMWLFSRRKPSFRFSLLYACAGSKAFFGKAAYLTIAVAPLALWTPFLTLCALLLPPEWFWAAWLVQTGNISGAAGDLYMFFHLLKEPCTLLVQDSGTAMNLYQM